MLMSCGICDTCARSSSFEKYGRWIVIHVLCDNDVSHGHTDRYQPNFLCTRPVTGSRRV